MKYFDYKKTHEENRKIFLSLCKKYHPDKPTGNESIMKEINNEWELYEKRKNSSTSEQKYSTSNNIRYRTDESEIIYAFWNLLISDYDDDEDHEEQEYIVFRGIKYLIDDNIFQTIGLRHGGFGLLEFMNSQQWQEHIKKHSI